MKTRITLALLISLHMHCMSAADEWPLADRLIGYTELRTMDGNGHGPFYLTSSADNARTWTKPTLCDTFGKWPQLLTLGNGITLASYGASGGPGYHVVRATVDPQGQVWEPPVRTRVSAVARGAYDTCGHTEMVALDDRTALLVYSDFNYPDADGVPRKSILVRRIQVAADVARP